MRMSEEKLILRPSWRCYIPTFVIFGIAGIVGVPCLLFKDLQGFGIFLIVLAAFAILTALLHRAERKYIITPQYVRSRRGILAINERELLMKDILEVGIRQSLLGRLLKVGNIYIASAATGGIEIKMEGLYQPQKIREKIDKWRLAQKS